MRDCKMDKNNLCKSQSQLFAATFWEDAGEQQRIEQWETWYTLWLFTIILF